MNEKLLPNHVRPKQKNGRKIYFCRLCRSYDVSERLAHLVIKHNASEIGVSRREFRSIIAEVFVEAVQ